MKNFSSPTTGSGGLRLHRRLRPSRSTRNHLARGGHPPALVRAQLPRAGPAAPELADSRRDVAGAARGGAAPRVSGARGRGVLLGGGADRRALGGALDSRLQLGDRGATGEVALDRRRERAWAGGADGGGGVGSINGRSCRLGGGWLCSSSRGRGLGSGGRGLGSGGLGFGLRRGSGGRRRGRSGRRGRCGLAAALRRRRSSDHDLRSVGVRGPGLGHGRGRRGLGRRRLAQRRDGFLGRCRGGRRRARSSSGGSNNGSSSSSSRLQEPSTNRFFIPAIILNNRVSDLGAPAPDPEGPPAVIGLGRRLPPRRAVC